VIFRYSLFVKMSFLILMLLFPVILLIGYSHQVSVEVVETELKQSNLRRLSDLLRHMDSSIGQLQQLAVFLNRDPSVRDLPNLPYKDSLLDRVRTKIAVQEKLKLQSLSSDWNNEFVVYSPVARQRVDLLSSAEYDENDLPEHPSASWSLEARTSESGLVTRRFKRYILDETMPNEETSKSKLVVEVSFDANNLAALLSNYQEGGRDSPFLYRAGEKTIHGNPKDAATAEALISWLNGRSLGQEEAPRVKLNGKDYQVYYLKSTTLGWYLVDFLPLNEVVSPLYESRNLFYAAIGVLLAASLIALALLYRNIQIPISQLMKGFKQIRDGRFSARVPMGSSREFVYMQMGFNEMAKEIQLLVESVYEEQIRSKDARLKQLQAQVNPHFLYNCLAYITSMNELDNREAVSSMAHNLGDYYRYMTRSDKETATLREELSVVANYLNIQRMRMPRLRFLIDIPEAVEGITIPRLSIQPIVENAVVHGIELKPGEAEIRITGSMEEGFCYLLVDDNGAGLPEERIQAMDKSMRLTTESDIGYGLWNVSQRLQLMFGPSAGVRFSPSPLGGLRVGLAWPTPGSESEKRDEH
jgi:Predicted signal transduction protein with a C-terminal ATPase domain